MDGLKRLKFATERRDSRHFHVFLLVMTLIYLVALNRAVLCDIQWSRFSIYLMGDVSFSSRASSLSNIEKIVFFSRQYCSAIGSTCCIITLACSCEASHFRTFSIAASRVILLTSSSFFFNSRCLGVSRGLICKALLERSECSRLPCLCTLPGVTSLF